MEYISCIISGASSALIFHPIDSLRSRYLFGNKNMSIRALYNGIMFNTLSTIIKQCATFPTQEFIKKKLANTPMSILQQNLISGLLSGIFLSIVSTPINTIKVPLMISAKSNTPSVIKNIYSTYGIRGFYRGGASTIARDSIWNTIYFPLFGYTNNIIDNRFISSIIAGTCSLCVSYPFDGIRMFRQNNKNNYNFWHGFKYAFNTSPENIKSFSVCLIRVPLSIAISHYIYLKSNDILHNK